MRRLLAFIALLSALSLPAYAQNQSSAEAPLGLAWGASIAEIQSKGVDLKEIGATDWGKAFVATKIDRALSDQAAAVLFFGHTDKLWRIVINGRPNSDDPFGNNVLARYTELQGILTEKYGSPRQHHRLGGSIYKEPKYFISGVRGGETSWYSNFETSALTIQLAISATDSSTGNYRLIYENKDLQKGFESSKRSKEKGSL